MKKIAHKIHLYGKHLLSYIYPKTIDPIERVWRNSIHLKGHFTFHEIEMNITHNKALIIPSGFRLPNISEQKYLEERFEFFDNKKKMGVFVLSFGRFFKLPANGQINQNEREYQKDCEGFYWSSSINNNEEALGLYFNRSIALVNPYNKKCKLSVQLCKL